MTAMTERIDSFDRRLRSLERELDELRRLAAADKPAVQPGPALWDIVTPARGTTTTTPPPSPEVRETFPAASAHVARTPRELDLSFMLGPRALACTGGGVTLLGIVFFFVLAVERGWIGATARVGLGAAASTAVFGAGLWLRRRYGDTYASVASVGAGVAGAYATLLAAAALYELVPAPLALLLAAAIATAGATVAIAWNAETIAGLGLVGALLVPVPVAFQGGLTKLGVAFAALVLAATATVAVRQRWRGLLVAGFAASLRRSLSSSPIATRRRSRSRSASG